MGRQLPHDQYTNRACIVCGNNIDDMRQALSVPVGSGLTANIHASCAASLQEEIDEVLSSVPEPTAPQRQYAGVPGEPEPMQLINKPCVFCQQQVTSGVTVAIGGIDYAAHPACKQRVLELIAGAIGVGPLSKRTGSIVGRG